MKVQKTAKSSKMETEGEWIEDTEEDKRSSKLWHTEMKPIQEIKDIIESKNYFFELISCHQNKKYKKKTLSFVDAMFDGFDFYFQKIAEIDKTTVLFIQLFSKNGSSFKKRDCFLITTNYSKKHFDWVEYDESGLFTLGYFD